MKIQIPETELKKLYVGQKLSTHKISKIFNCNPETIRRRLIKLNIERKNKIKVEISEEELKRLYEKDRKSALQIAKLYKISDTAVRKKLIRFNIKRRDPNDYHSWKEVANILNPNLNKKRELSYILGVLVGDGFLYQYGNTYSINLESKDKKFCEKFSETLKSIGLNPSILRTRNKTRSYWKTIAISKKFYVWFKKLKEKERKEIAIMHPREFIKGVYESEGNIFISSKIVKNKKYVQPILTIVNTNKNLIKLIKNLLFRLNFHPNLNFRRPPFPRKPLWILRMSKRAEVERFFKEIKPDIKYLNYASG